jgi:DNA repair exonuclease SbcCD ATPase subunit
VIPLRISASNFATYGTLDFEFPEGLTSILGRNTLTEGADSNGSGKSSLLSAVTVALFGGSLATYLTAGEQDMRVELEFSHGDHTYRVRRSYNAKGRGKSATDFERFVDSDPENNWETLTEESQAQTDAAIIRTIGMTKDTFERSLFSAQNAQHFASPELQPRERKAVLGEVLGLATWDVLLELVRSDMRAAEAELSAISLRLGDLEAEQESEAELKTQAEQAAAAVAVTTAAIQAAEVAHEKAREALAEAEKVAEKRAALEREVAAAQKRADEFKHAMSQADDAREDAANLSAKLDALAEHAARVEPLEQELREREAAEASRAAVETNRKQALDNVLQLRRLAQTSRELAAAFTIKGKELKTRRDELAEKGAGVCSECGQPLGGEALETALASLDADLETLREQLVAAKADATEKEAAANEAEQGVPLEPEPGLDLAPLRRQAAEAREATVQLAAGRERLANLEKLAAAVHFAEFVSEMTEARNALSRAKADLAAAEAVDPEKVAALLVAVSEGAAAMPRARQHADDARAEQVRCEERLRSLAAAAERTQEALAARTRLNTRLDLLKALEGAYGRNGIPALILENSAIPQLEAEAQRILGELGVPYRIELVTQRETKSGTLKDTLDVVVHEPAGPRRYETYSGGEQTRLEFALRIALARLVASRHGSESGILALDELAFLDGAGMAQIASVLRGLDEFRSVLLVSHDDRLSDAFDQQIVVVRDEDGSRLEEVNA